MEEASVEHKQAPSALNGIRWSCKVRTGAYMTMPTGGYQVAEARPKALDAFPVSETRAQLHPGAVDDLTCPLVRVRMQGGRDKNNTLRKTRREDIVLCRTREVLSGSCA